MDELYTWFVLKYLEKQYSSNINYSYYENKRYQEHPNILQTAISDINLYADSKLIGNDIGSAFLFKSKRIERVLEKLALGHMVFELSEGYYTEPEDENAWRTQKILYSFLPTLSKNTIHDYSYPVDITGLILPEVGSRVYDHIFFVKKSIDECGNGDSKQKEAVLLDWTVVQENKYRYLALFLFEMNMIQVNIVIDEFLFVSVLFSTAPDSDDENVEMFHLD